MMKIALMIVCLLACMPQPVVAQTWQWGRSGGGISDEINSNSREEVTHCVTDENGNVYAVSRITSSPHMRVDTHRVNLPPTTDATLLYSYKCDGTFRWAKVMQIRAVRGLGVDSMGGVYIAGNIGSNEFFMGSLTTYNSDTSATFFSSNMKTLVMAKLDTSGNKKWIRMPEPDTVSWRSVQAATMDMDVEKNGTIHWLCDLTPGNYQGNGLVVSRHSIHVLRYSRDGQLSGSTPLAMVMPVSYPYASLAKLTYSKGNNRYVVTGSVLPGDPSLTIGGTAIDKFLYVASFEGADGSFKWVKQAGSHFVQSDCKSKVDNQNNIYVSGLMAHGHTFNGFTQNNLYTTLSYTVPFIQKMDAAGNAIWSHGSGSRIGNSVGALVLSGSEVALTGSYGGVFRWSNGIDSFNSTPGNTGVNVFLTRFNAGTGSYIKTDTLYSLDPGFEYPFCLAADKRGNYYVGGRYETNIVVNSMPIYKSGGESDFFLAKFGSNVCSGPVGVNAVPGTIKATVTPNPTYGPVSIVLPTGGNDTKARLYSVAGQLLMEEDIPVNGRLTLDLSKHIAGVYFLEIRQSRNVFFNKVLKL